MDRIRSAAIVCAFCAAVASAFVSCHDDVAVEKFVAAAAANAALVKPGDVVLVHPPWRDDVVADVKRALPAASVVTEAFAPRHGDLWPSLVVIADTGWPLPRVLADKAPKRAGDVAVFRIDAASTGDALDLRRARVSVDGAACPWNAQRRRHVCAHLPEWMTVGEDTLVIAGKRARCIWAHPKTGSDVVIDYGVVDASVLELSLALSDQAVANPTGAAVTAKLVVDGKEASVTAQKTQGFVTTSLDVHKRAPVTLTITTPHDGQRHTCYRLEEKKQ